MDASLRPLNLVSFAPSSSFSNALYAALQAFSQRVRNISGSDWLAQGLEPLEGPIILAIGSDELPRDCLLSGLREQWIAPALAVIADDTGWWDPEILTCCREFLSWPCRREELLLRLTRSCEGFPPLQVSSHEPEFLEELVKLNLIGQSPAFLGALELIKSLSQCEAPILIEGETGTGKEMAARAIHYLGLRRDYPFIPVNCGALSDTLLEDELFGHERGAYIDAKESQEGLVAQAQRGTLFLDKVESLSLKAQAALLRFLQSQEYKPLGSCRLKQADARIIAASNADLSALVERGDFRQDLLFRLNVMPLPLPPLRERPGDAERLAEHFLCQYSLKYRRPPQAFHPITLAWIKTYPWPGNVRELENFVHRALLLSKDLLISLPAGMLSSEDKHRGQIESPGDWAGGFNKAKAKIRINFEKQYLQWLMVECRGNISLAARQTGKEQSALGKLLKKHQIDRILYTK